MNDQIRDDYSSCVQLGDTDAFGVLYWGAPIRWSQMGYENLVRGVGHPVEELLHTDADMPVVNAVLDYYCPLRLGDPILVQTMVIEVGNRSFQTETRIHTKEGVLAVRVIRVHVATRRSGGPAPLPEWVRRLAPPCAARQKQ